MIHISEIDTICSNIIPLLYMRAYSCHNSMGNAGENIDTETDVKLFIFHHYMSFRICLAYIGYKRCVCITQL